MRGILAFLALLAIASAQFMLDGFSTVRRYSGPTITTIPPASTFKTMPSPAITASPKMAEDYPPDYPNPTLVESNLWATCLGVLYGLVDKCDGQRMPPTVAPLPTTSAPHAKGRAETSSAKLFWPTGVNQPAPPGYQRA